MKSSFIGDTIRNIEKKERTLAIHKIIGKQSDKQVLLTLDSIISPAPNKGGRTSFAIVGTINHSKRSSIVSSSGSEICEEDESNLSHIDR